MRYNAAGLLRDKAGARREFAFEHEEIARPGEWFRDVAGNARLLRTNRGILVQAEVQGFSKELCSRCLGDAQVSIEATLEEEFYPTNHFDGFDRRDSVEDAEPADPAFLIDEHNILDLREAVRQALVSSAPMAPVCDSDCKGLCPVCSADRNIVRCDCGPGQPAPVWAESLRALKIK